MLKELQQVLRLLMVLRKQSGNWRSAGGLLVLLWPGPGTNNKITNCTALTEFQEKLFPCASRCPAPDPEELCAFADMHGPLRFLLSLQGRDTSQFSPEWRSHAEDFLSRFSRTNAGVGTDHATFKCKIVRKIQLSRSFDVTCRTQPPVCVGKRAWCQGGHPVLGGRLPLRIPPEVMDRGLFGELSLQPVTLLSPCVLQYPNLATQLTRIQVLVYSPSNVPVPVPPTFLHYLPDCLDFQELGLRGLHSSTTTDLQSDGTMYSVEQGNCEEPEPEGNLAAVQQSLSLFLFLEHSDPFTSHLSDVMATEELLEHHLEAIMNSNRQAVTTALKTELKNTLNIQRHKDQERLCSAHEVMLSSAVSIVSSSSNMKFRNACMDSMKVHDTHELSASLHETMRRVTSWRCLPKPRCYSALASVLYQPLGSLLHCFDVK
ncbi:type 2 DNA topoisomerase 6 subunit B-like [Diretmus argenteus]